MIRFPGLSLLTSIRGPFAFIVVYRHCLEALGYGASLHESPGFIGRGEFLLDCFFILSGFLIAMLHREEFFSAKHPGMDARTVRHFLVLRIARFYPLHLATLLVLGAAVLVVTPNTPGTSFSGEAFFWNLLLMQAWGTLPTLSFNYPAWSISTEWFTYLLFPLLALPLNRLSSTRTQVLAIAVLFAFMTAFVALHPGRTWAIQLGWGALLRNTVDFAIGCLLARLAPAALHWRLPKGVSWDIIAILAMATAFIGTRYYLPDVGVVAAFTVMIFALVLCRGGLQRFLGQKWFVYWGDISFSIYLIHALVIMAVNRLAPSLNPGTADGFVLYTVIVLAVSTALAAMSFQFLEQPARRWIRNTFAGNPRLVARTA